MVEEPLYVLIRRIREYAQSHRALDERELSDDLEFLAARWRELGRPPACAEVPDSMRKRLARTYGSFPKAKELAGDLLTPSERERLNDWRCDRCQRVFTSVTGLQNHHRVCRVSSR